MNPGDAVRQTPWDLSHRGIPAGGLNHSAERESAKEVRRETNEACHEHLSHPEKVAGEPGGSPQTCHISTWCAARVASPQSPILRPSKSQATNDFSMCKENGNINPQSGSICDNLNWPLRGPEKGSTSVRLRVVMREAKLFSWTFK